MPFTVAHQGGTKDGQYRDYLLLLSRQLLHRGVPLDSVPRVPEGKNWLYVWESKEEATAFAEALKKETRDRRWHVQPVNGTPSVGPLQPLEIEISCQGDGWIFGLGPLMEKALQARFPGSCPYDCVVIGTETGNAPPKSPNELRRLASHALLLVTGLTGEQLRTFGTFRVVDPVTGQEVLPPCPIEGLSAGLEASLPSCPGTPSG
jgi:hypothetical protein